ncbi:type III-B CRISPR module-associated Cmr3 family protein [Kyrpidia tusciae]|uniref:CRISPR-associated protein, Cmr3 n=1 Tax=Kyrpidia tusciae (strain DSM 2912 / NBRC 15312 / T2) TaxID=562970 RepID=D5WY23_KYRT2|nr:type III-B CRISPR module-associated Cmr3 family protein [Kyrpidia tusciae]ADG06082.1 CRISPR-associated protein, Cmr3 [Kyrpidia tusciae DSM 2912]
MIHVQIWPRDPLVVRDARPFGPEGGNRMVCLDWPYPSVLAGFLRTWVGKHVVDSPGIEPFTPTRVQWLKSLTIGGPYPCVGEKLYFPAPLDVVLFRDDDSRSLQGIALRPHEMGEGEGCDLPHPALLPVVVTEDLKPAKGPAFWSRERMMAWLMDDHRSNVAIPAEEGTSNITEFQLSAPEYLYPLKRDVRVHVHIDPLTGRAGDEQLFSTSGLAFPHGVGIVTWVEGLEESSWPSVGAVLAPLGGERRLSFLQTTSPLSWFPDDELSIALDGADGVRMVLATPGLFRYGWLPGWIDPDTLQGTPPGMNGLRLQLRSACVGRWKPLSGWSIEKGHYGPKPIRRIVPAGSVYFFEVLAGNPGAYIKDAWLRSVADEEQDRRDGFANALWGRWKR